jgi:hypothetical protein
LSRLYAVGRIWWQSMEAGAPATYYMKMDGNRFLEHFVIENIYNDEML